jgi:hypothetical protein
VELLRVSRNAWGQEVLEGVSWDLLWVAVGVGATFILIHMTYMWLRPPKQIQKD